MSNSSLPPSYFEFTVFSDYGSLRYLFFCLCLLIFMTIISANAVIILSVCLETSLHQPMYIFICSLCCNSLFGTSGFFPRFLMDLLSDTHLIWRPLCFVQIYVIHTYKTQELSILSIMAYDRFVAICQPLHYHRRMIKVMRWFWVFVVFSPLCLLGHFFYLAVSFPLCGYKLNRILCTSWSVVQASCVDTNVISTTGPFLSVTLIFVPLFFVLYSYLRILLVCRRSSSDIRGKALQTCLPHILTFVNFCISVFCEVPLSQNKVEEVNAFVIIVLSLEFLIIPPISNPLIYGLNLPLIRGVIVRFLRKC